MRERRCGCEMPRGNPKGGGGRGEFPTRAICCSRGSLISGVSPAISHLSASAVRATDDDAPSRTSRRSTPASCASDRDVGKLLFLRFLRRLRTIPTRRDQGVTHSRETWAEIEGGCVDRGGEAHTQASWRCTCISCTMIDVLSDVGAQKVPESVSCSIHSQHYHPHRAA